MAMEWNWAGPVLFGVGVVAGFVDAIAGGGGLLTVPALLSAGLPPQVALGTNKLQSSCGTALATWNYARAGLVPWRRWIPGVLMTFAAALGGAATVTAIDPGWLRRVVPVALGAVAVYTALKPDLGTAERPGHSGSGLACCWGFTTDSSGPARARFGCWRASSSTGWTCVARRA